MVSVKSIVGVLCYMFLIVLGLKTSLDIINSPNTESMMIFAAAAVILILLGTYLIQMGEREDEANRANKRKKRLLKDSERIRKLK
ncbi:MAG: hypothetical protein U9N35_08380 [Euryarchaeota archaeon]|nr:hypothetical protein [Euryarchaeota archaeon]